ncbi:MAG: hypothetical protein RLZZ344_1640 [Pseudomonadota bacterium]
MNRRLWGFLKRRAIVSWPRFSTDQSRGLRMTVHRATAAGMISLVFLSTSGAMAQTASGTTPSASAPAGATTASPAGASPSAAWSATARIDPRRPFSEELQAGLNALDRRHYSTALRAWRALADKGESRAQNNIGLMYEKGLGVTQSYVEAMAWYRKAADQGLPEAQFNLGTLYHNGYGVEINNGQAVSWFRKAADQQLPDAHYMMGLHLWEGKGIRRDPLAALDQFLKGARQGNVNAQFMAGYLFLSEEPTGKANAVAGYTWAEVSRLNGYAEAVDITEFLNYRMKEKELAQAKDWVRRCMATKYADCPRI